MVFIFLGGNILVLKNSTPIGDLDLSVNAHLAVSLLVIHAHQCIDHYHVEEEECYHVPPI